MEVRVVPQYRLYPHVWESCAGPEPVLGPIEAPDARSAYLAAVRAGHFPAGPVFGVRAVRSDGGGLDVFWSPPQEARRSAVH